MYIWYVVALIKKQSSSITAECAAFAPSVGGYWSLSGHSHVFDAHPRALVNDHDAMAVTHLQDFLSVGVVAGAERIGPQPLQ